MKSGSDYKNVINFLKRFDDIYNISYLIVNGALRLKDGALFGEKDMKNIVLKIHTNFLYFIKEGEIISPMHPLVEFYTIQKNDNVIPTSLIRLSDVEETEIDKSLGAKRYIRKGIISFLSKDEFLNFLKEINFTFLDGSIII